MAQSQMTALCSFIEDFYKDLTEVAHFSKSQAWTLVGRCVAQVFEAQRRVRSNVAKITDFKSLVNKSKIIWAVLQCHRIMMQFTTVEFRGHPTIVKELGLFQLTERVDPSEFDSLRSTYKDLTSRVKPVESTVQKLSSQVNTMQQQIATLNSKVNKFKPAS